ncbi:glucose-1-phosphate thymidylyltransferase [Flavobacteriaceae bacterium Ap0902]|nr:glucose-1-phosphate thymidylyltransferase [Flavobacteriaceae bacterium Ap0902]
MNVVLFCKQEQQLLLPLTYMKPAGELRMGILTFKERWQKLLDASISYLTEAYLSDLFPLQAASENIFIHSCYLPTYDLVNQIKLLKVGEVLKLNDEVIAFKGSLEDFQNENFQKIINFKNKLIHINRPYDLFSYNQEALDFDFQLLTKDRKSASISNTNGVINPSNIFLEEGAKVEFAVLNATAGSIYIGRDAEICEGSLVRGGLALCDHAKLNLGTKIYGATTIGPWCKVGGEVNNSILTAYSNKGHDGFLGNSVIGEWCNLGADTNNSNLKNNYSEVKLWDYTQDLFENTGLQFCGLIMGDHSKSAINTQFNTGTVTGVFANVFKVGFPPNKVNSFTWGGSSESPKFNLEAAYQVADRMMQRRKVELTPEIKSLIAYLYDYAN